MDMTGAEKNPSLLYPARHVLDDVLERLFEQPTDQGWKYEPHGGSEDSLWGSGTWVHATDPDGREHYFRVVVEPFRG
jgi:hypothetical protein